MKNKEKSNPRILFADRNRHVREFLKREFEAEGYQVQTAASDREVVTTIEAQGPPDVLVIDLDLPVMGLEALQQIRQRYPAMPYIVHSLHTELALDPVVLAARAFIEKTENLGGLKEAVMEILSKAAIEAENKD
jgi:CheY-like chemotaxis protein